MSSMNKKPGYPDKGSVGGKDSVVLRLNVRRSLLPPEVADDILPPVNQENHTKSGRGVLFIPRTSQNNIDSSFFDTLREKGFLYVGCNLSGNVKNTNDVIAFLNFSRYQEPKKEDEKFFALVSVLSSNFWSVEGYDNPNRTIVINVGGRVPRLEENGSVCQRWNDTHTEKVDIVPEGTLVILDGKVMIL